MFELIVSLLRSYIVVDQVDFFFSLGKLNNILISCNISYILMNYI